ncbi:MAG: hypothetical protein U1E56_01840 [Bauldia sp.]
MSARLLITAVAVLPAALLGASAAVAQIEPPAALLEPVPVPEAPAKPAEAAAEKPAPEKPAATSPAPAAGTRARAPAPAAGPAGAATANASPAATNNPAPAAGSAAARSAASVNGTWTGVETQLGRTSSYPVKIIITDVGAATDYPEQHCAGKLTRIGTNGRYTVYAEKITVGAYDPVKDAGCIDGVVTLSRAGADLAVGWVGVVENQVIVASGILSQRTTVAGRPPAGAVVARPAAAGAAPSPPAPVAARPPPAPKP